MKRVEAALTIVLTVAALVVVALLVRRELGQTAARAVGTAASDRLLESAAWDSLWALGQLLSAGGGTSRMVILADFECPACRAFHARVQKVTSAFPGRIAIRLVHLPLPYHRFAQPAARLFECAAADAAVASRLADEVYRVQDSLGLIPWAVLARRAGAKDPEAVVRCSEAISDTARFARIAAGVRFGEELEVRGTPSVVVDGILRGTPPTEAELMALAKR